jgi:hypothetical protein
MRQSAYHSKWSRFIARNVRRSFLRDEKSFDTSSRDCLSLLMDQIDWSLVRFLEIWIVRNLFVPKCQISAKKFTWIISGAHGSDSWFDIRFIIDLICRFTWIIRPTRYPTLSFWPPDRGICLLGWISWHTHHTSDSWPRPGLWTIKCMQCRVDSATLEHHRAKYNPVIIDLPLLKLSHDAWLRSALLIRVNWIGQPLRFPRSYDTTGIVGAILNN